MAHASGHRAHGWYETIRMARWRDADPRAVDQAVLPLQYLACARPRPRSPVRFRASAISACRHHVALVSERPAYSASQATRISTISAAIMNSRIAACIGPKPISSPIRATNWTLADRYATDEMFDAHAARLGDGALPNRCRRRPTACWRTAMSSISATAPSRSIHTPGHSPGGIGLYEKKTGILLSGDIVYDGPLIDDVYHSDRDDYVATLSNACATSPSRSCMAAISRASAKARYRQLIDEYLAQKRQVRLPSAAGQIGGRNPICHARSKWRGNA